MIELLLDGDPDQGKSYIALDICARLSTGRPISDGSPGPGVVPSLILQMEEKYPPPRPLDE